MKVVTKQFTVYTLKELNAVNEKAFNRASQWISENIIAWQGSEFEDLVHEDIVNILPDSDLQIEYSLSYSQGDGVNMFGTLCLTDVIALVKRGYYYTATGCFSPFTPEELDKLSQYLTEEYSDNYIELPHNHYYVYCAVDRIRDEVECSSEEADICGLYSRLIEAVISLVSHKCSEYENMGYDGFYPAPSVPELYAVAEANDLMFMIDGTVYID